MFQVTFTGEPDKEGRRKRLAKTTVNTDSAAEAMTHALAIVNKQKKQHQDTLSAIRVIRVAPSQKEVVFSVGESK